MKAGAGFFIAIRYLLGRAREGGRYLRGAAAGIALSLVPIVVTLIVADGMIRGITDRFLELGTGHIQIFDYLESENTGDALTLIRDMEGLRGIWAERDGLAVIMGSKGSRGATVRAVEKSFWEDRGSLAYLKTIAGSSRPETDREILLGEDLASSIGAEPGQTVRIMTLRELPDGGTLPRITAFTVRGVISSGYRELDSLWCVMSLEAGREILPGSSSSFSVIKIRDPYKDAEKTAAKMREILGPSFGVYSWKQLQRSQYSSYESTRQLLLFIMALIVLVAAVNVSAATSMLAIERRQDIAVLKTFGAEPAGVTSIFIWSAFITGLLGSLLGISAGLLIGRFINPLIGFVETVLGFFSGLFKGGEVKILDPGYYLEAIPLIIDWPAVFIIGLFTILSSILASWLPARKAGKVKPVEILRRY